MQLSLLVENALNLLIEILAAINLLSFVSYVLSNQYFKSHRCS